MSLHSILLCLAHQPPATLWFPHQERFACSRIACRVTSAIACSPFAPHATCPTRPPRVATWVPCCSTLVLGVPASARQLARLTVQGRTGQSGRGCCPSVAAGLA